MKCSHLGWPPEAQGLRLCGKRLGRGHSEPGHWENRHESKCLSSILLLPCWRSWLLNGAHRPNLGLGPGLDQLVFFGLLTGLAWSARATSSEVVIESKQSTTV
jgi:hypothetical protein